MNLGLRLQSGMAEKNLTRLELEPAHLAESFAKRGLDTTADVVWIRIGGRERQRVFMAHAPSARP